MLKKTLTALLIGASLISSVQFAYADTTPAQPTSDELKQKLSQLLRANIDELKSSELKGFYEFILGDDVFYVDSTGNYLIRGEVIDLQNKINLSQRSSLEFSKKMVANLPIDKAIKIVKGSGQHKLFIFSDPDCPFCKKLEAELTKLKDTTVYIFLTPIVQLHKDAMTHSKQIICSSNPAKAWVSYMTEGKGISSKSKTDCTDASKVADTVEIANKLGITGTPTIFFENGMRVPGAVPVAEIQKYLENLKK